MVKILKSVTISARKTYYIKRKPKQRNSCEQKQFRKNSHGAKENLILVRTTILSPTEDTVDKNVTLKA